MFLSKIKEKSKAFISPGDFLSVVSKSMLVHGDVEAEHDMRIDGKVAGNVYCKARVVVGATGVIEGELHAANADVFGTVNGDIYTKDMLCLKGDSTINGNVQVGRINIEPDALFNGKCSMRPEGIVTAKKLDILQPQL